MEPYSLTKATEKLNKLLKNTGKIFAHTILLTSGQAAFLNNRA